MENIENIDNFDLSLDDIFSKLDEENSLEVKNIEPFKFLDSYTKEDKDIFFGREEETEDIYRKFYTGKLLLIYGRSGTGKSSVLNCGLLNKISKEDLYPILVRTGKKPNENFLAELKKHTNSKETLPEKLTEDIFNTHSKPVALIFDQFEEIFILSHRDERNKLVHTLKKLLALKQKINIVIIIREEYLANLTEFETVIPELFRNRLRVEKMDKSRAKQIIEEPCKVCGIKLENGVSENIIDRLTDSGGSIELTYLQVLLDRLYKKVVSKKEKTIKLSHVDELKSIGNVLTQFLDEQLSQMHDAEKGEAVLKKMISPDGTKRAMSVEDISDDLRSTGNPIDTVTLNEILQYFVNVRIITDKDEHDNYELRHDSIAARIYERLTALEKELTEVKKFVENAFYTFQKRNKYLDEKDLKYLAAYEDKLYLKSDLKQFIADSKKKLTKSKRLRQLIFTISAIILIVVLSGFTVWAMRERNKAQQAMKSADIARKESDEKSYQYFYKDALRLYKMGEYLDAIKQFNFAKSIAKLSKSHINDTIAINTEIQKSQKAAVESEQFQNLMKNAMIAAKNNNYEQAFLLYSKAAQTPYSKDRLISELTELLKNTDGMVTTYRANAEAIRSLNDMEKYKVEMNKANQLQSISIKIQKLISSLK